MMQAFKKFLFAFSICLTLTFTGLANTQYFGQDRKPPERPKEKDKEESKSKDENRDRRNDDKRNDDKKSGDKKKP